MRVVKLCLITALVAMLAGCSTADNKVVEMIDGQKVEHTLSNEAIYYRTQLAYQQNRKPILEMQAKEGEQITLGGVKKLVVWGYDNDRGKLPTYEHPWAKTVREWGGIAGNVLTIGVGAYFMSDIMKTVTAQAGTHISDAFKSTGDYSSPSYLKAGDFAPTYNTVPAQVVRPEIVKPEIVTVPEGG